MALLVEPAFDKPGDAPATHRMVPARARHVPPWAENRHMQLTEIAADARGPGGIPMLLISGFGAHRVLAPEGGLHVLDPADDDRNGLRATARVRLAIAPLDDLPKGKQKLILKAALQGAGQPSALVRRYREAPSPLVRDMITGWRSGRLDAVLRGDFDLMAAGRSRAS